VVRNSPQVGTISITQPSQRRRGVSE
jgi:hypothetical protein